MNKRIKLLTIILIFVLAFGIFSAGTIIFPNNVQAAAAFADSCDSVSGWTSQNTMSIDTTDKREGIGSLIAEGSQTIWFQKVYSPGISTGVTESNGYLELWLYVSDITKFTGGGQIEITSSGTSDVDEYSWSIGGLSLANGWNQLNLKISDAYKMGSPNLNAINFIRVYQHLTDSITARVDYIRFEDNSPSGEVIKLTVANNLTAGWTSQNTLSIDAIDKLEGIGSLKAEGSQTVWFQRRFSTPINTGVTESNGYLKLWLYVSDITKFTGGGQIEITSSGTSDVDEYSWSIGGLSPGWNELILKISDANKIGNPNLSAINYIRIYQYLTGSIVTKLDYIRFDTAVGAVDKCDSTSGWYSQNTLSLDTADRQEGAGSLKAEGSQTVWFQKVYSPAVNTGVTESNGFLKLWLYVSDTTKFSGGGQIEITSSGTCDVDEYSWSMGSLSPGWNELILKISDANKIGNPNLSAINFIRIYRPLSASITTGIDYIRLEAESILDKCDSTSGWTSWNTLSLDTADKQEGAGSLKAEGSQTVWFRRRFSTPINTGVTESNGYLKLWLYVSDVTKFTGSGQIEITSSGTYDADEYGWSISRLSLLNGWNELNLKISAAYKVGNPNLSAINFIRIHQPLTGSITARADYIRFDTVGIVDKCDSNDDIRSYKYYNIFSFEPYTFQSGDNIEYDVKILNNIDGAGGIDIVNTDDTRFRDDPDWKDQNGISGNPSADISTQSYNTWYHRKLAVPAGLVGKQAKRWDIAGEEDTAGLTYSALYDNIVITGSNGKIKKVLFQSAADSYFSNSDGWENATGTMSFSNVNGNPLPLPAPLAAPNPRIITTQFPTDDIVIAEYVVTDSPYNADNTGVNDAATAIQKAINDCYITGGGTVWMPAGKYKITGTIEVKPFVTLRGDWRDPDIPGSGYGTVIVADVPSNTADAPGLFRIGGSAGCVGLTVYYPNQNASNPVPYPYTFEIPGTAWMGAVNFMMSSVMKCTLLDSYKGISGSVANRADGNIAGHEMATITDVKGTALYKGMEMNKSSDVDIYERVNFNNSYWANAGSEFNAPDRLTLDAWTRANGTAFIISSEEGTQMIGLGCSDYNIGIKTIAGIKENIWGDIYGASILNTNIALSVTSLLSYKGLAITRSTLQGNIGAEPYSIKKDISSGYLKLTDCTLTGSIAGQGITISNPGDSPAAYPYKSNLPKPPNANFYNVKDLPSYVSDANAAADGTTDDTTAVQNALTYAGSNGGGTVYMPAGRYRISTHLSVPANVELRGASSVPNRDQIGLSNGTVLMAYEGRKTVTPDTDTAFITLNGDNSGVRGLRVWYPEHNPVYGIVPYPYTVRGNGNGVYAINLGFTNSYYGIDLKTNRCDNHYIRRLSAGVFKKGIVVGQSTEGWIEGSLANATNTIRTGFSNWPGSSYLFDYVINYTKANLTWITVDGASNEHFLNDFSLGSNLHLYYISGTGVHFNGAEDGGGIGIKVDGGSATIVNFLTFLDTISIGPVTIYNLI